LLLYYISDRSQFPGDENSRRSRLLETIAQATRCNVDYVQLREKDLPTRKLEILAREVVAIVHQLRTGNQQPKTALLINSHADIALACGADGVHLRSNDVSPPEIRKIWPECGTGALARVTVGVSCHTPVEVSAAATEGADFVVFGPVFNKKTEKETPSGGNLAGLSALREACREKIPVLALGGVTLENADLCIEAGAAGIAGIRLFQENEMDTVVATLRSKKSY
jgi:thiamine-phosphate pyrophosphorylase